MTRSQLHFWPEETAGDRIQWSVSREKRVRSCARRYHLHHFASRGGWQPGATAEARELYILRHLRNRYMWVGEVVHELVELALSAWRKGDNVPMEALIERGTHRMRAGYAESIQAMYKDRPHQACGLVEHELHHEVPRDEWKRQRDRMETCVRNFFGLSLTATIKSIPAWRWLALESSGSFELDGAIIVVRPDCAWRDESGRVVIVDWKTGKPRADDERLQLSVYGLFARRAWGTGPGEVRAVVAYLETGDVQETQLAAADLAWGEGVIKESLKTMRELGQHEGDRERFPKTEDVAMCALCCFKRHCGR